MFDLISVERISVELEKKDEEEFSLLELPNAKCVFSFHFFSFHFCCRKETFSTEEVSDDEMENDEPI